MSDAGDILTALTTDVETAVSGVTVVLTASHPGDLKAADLPWCRLLLVDYSAEHLDWSQEQRTWTIHGLLVVEGGTREAMQLLLDAIRDEIKGDTTLNPGVASLDRASCATGEPYSSPDDAQVLGAFNVQAEKVTG